MSIVNLQPVQFVKEGSELEVRFVGDEDRLKWYKGVVKEIHRYGTDENSSFIECSVLYDDGEFVPDAVFYNDDFDQENSVESWRFTGNINLLISFFIKSNSEIQNLKNELKSTEEVVKKLVAESIVSEDEDEVIDEEPETPIEQTQKHTVWNLLQYVCVGLTSVFLYRLLYGQ